MTDDEIEISDHYVLRWMQRKHGIDVEALRRQIGDTIPPSVKRAILQKIPVNVKHPDGFTTVANDGNLVTLLEPRVKPRPRGRRRRASFDMDM